MAVIILVRRVARADKLEAFNESYRAERPQHEGFIAEFLTRVDTSDDLPPGLRSLPLAAPGGVTFVNVAIWRSAKDFDDCFHPKAAHNPETEMEDRVRVVLDVVDGVGEVTRTLLGLAA